MLPNAKTVTSDRRRPLAEIVHNGKQLAQQQQQAQMIKTRAQKIANVAYSSQGSSSFSTTTTSSSSFSSSATFASRSTISQQFSDSQYINQTPSSYLSQYSSSPPSGANLKTLTSIQADDDYEDVENLSSRRATANEEAGSSDNICTFKLEDSKLGPPPMLKQLMTSDNQSSNSEAATTRTYDTEEVATDSEPQSEICTSDSCKIPHRQEAITNDSKTSRLGSQDDAKHSDTNETTNYNDRPPISIRGGGGNFKQQSPQLALISDQQPKQMFSFKQLALNSRNLAKKRGSIQRGPAGALARLFEPADQTMIATPQDNSSSNSSGESSCVSEGVAYDTSAQARKQSVGNRQRQPLTRSVQRQPDQDDLSDDYEISDDDEYDDDVDDEEDEEEDCLDNDSGSGGDDRMKKKRRRRRAGTNRRPSADCNCDHIATKIDCDGLPITDVDLVTYKDLCQMEQAHHMRTNRPQRQPSSSSQYTLKPSSAGFSSIRRSSLQEESGAYYELCTSNEERTIRRKYHWFPPSLCQLELVDKFFACFQKDKIPLVAAESSPSGGESLLASNANTKSKLDTINNEQQQPVTPPVLTTAPANSPSAVPSNVSSGISKKPPPHPASGFYRDEQISFQLPRQDISLDYCSYQMDEASRLAYAQFVERRNSRALDVGTVVQVGVPSAASMISKDVSSNKPTASTSTRANRLATFQRSGSQTPIEIRPERQRKASTMSQSAAMSALVAFGQQQHQLDQLQQHLHLNQGPQRCRRCLVRFEDQQLAVVAPNFIIGFAIYPNHHRRPPQSPPVHIQETDLSFCFGPLKVHQRQQQAETPGATPPNAALFHPTCFTCSFCKEFLVDLVYCLRDNKLYCLRHYGESLRPRCNWCQELIFSDEYLKAMKENFHADHFLCRHCDSNLAGQRYVLKDEKPFCIQCYETNFANNCDDCNKPIGIDSRDLSYKDRHWHETCFVCNKCQQSLIDKPFGSKSEKVYCAECYEVTFAARCDCCKNPFRAGSKKMEYRGRQWHDSCFCCSLCSNTIGSNSFIPKNEEIYCIKCYEYKYATKCIKCKLVIVSGGVTFRNEPWHRECFNCCNCNKSLAGQRFTTREVAKETVNHTNKTNQPHNAYCIECYGELFAKKCYACSQAITGLGGTRFVTFEDRSWHNDCFLCNDCNLSLVGKGFIIDGPESILCGECARAKLR